MKKKIFLLFCLLVLVFSGCTININSKSGIDGGVYKTINRGDDWLQQSVIYRVGDVAKNFNGTDISAMVIDPTDSQAVYVGTENEGMYYTYDDGNGWQQTLTNLGKINDIAINPKDRCIIYVAIGNRVYKSNDCNRHWEYQFIETRDDPNNTITSIALDNYNPNIVYVGTSGKGLLKSEDAGYSWRVIDFFKAPIAKVLVNPQDSRIIYVATYLNGLFKTSDKGVNWKEIFSKEQVDAKKNILVYRQLMLDPSVSDGLMYASQYGLMRSINGGNNWDDIKLLTPPSTTFIYSLAINPKNGRDIYYGTNSALYRSEDGGQNWITRKLPTTRSAKFLIINFDSPNTLYLGVKKIKEKEKFL